MHAKISFYTLTVRECYRFLRLFRQTLFPPLITTALFILIFGYSLGGSIRSIHGFPYIQYILPGLLAMAVITNSYANSSTSLYMSRMDLSMENLTSAPLSSFQLVSTLVLGGWLRGLSVGLLTLAVAIPMIGLNVQHWAILLGVLSLSSVFFSCLGILSALWSEGWDQIATFTNFVITPFIYLGGVFYSVAMLPNVWRQISQFNPIYYMVDATRYAILGHSDVAWSQNVGILLGCALLSFGVCVYLFKIGYKLVR